MASSVASASRQTRPNGTSLSGAGIGDSGLTGGRPVGLHKDFWLLIGPVCDRLFKQAQVAGNDRRIGV